MAPITYLDDIMSFLDPPGRSFTEDHVRECYSLMTKMVVTFMKATDSHDLKHPDDLIQEIIDPYQNTYRKEIRGNAVKMGIFRALLLSWGTEYALKEIQEYEAKLQEWRYVSLPSPFFHMLLLEEELDKYDRIIPAIQSCFNVAAAMEHGGTKSGIQSWVNVAAAMNDMTSCPREAIKFFHRYVMLAEIFQTLFYSSHISCLYRRNGCDCLKDIYYKLKDSTKRTSNCDMCGVVKEVSHLYRCSRCNCRQYCSRECAAADKKKYHGRVCHILAAAMKANHQQASNA